MYQVNVSEEDVKFINLAASILMPHYQGQQFLNSFNTQIEQNRRAQAAAAKEKLDVQIAEAVKAALDAKTDGVTGD